MRIGKALEALDFIAGGMPTFDRHRRLDSYGAAQALLDRLRAIAKTRGLTSSTVNAQFMKIQLSIESLAGLGDGRASDEQQVADVRSAIDVLCTPQCFGLYLEAME